MMSVYEKNETFRILNHLCDVSLDKFDDRLKLQKLGYLAQALGASGGFTFSWYLHGPYSPSLTKMLYSAEKVGVLGKEANLSEEEKDIVQDLEKLLGDRIDDPRYLELYASIWYLLPNRAITCDDIGYVVETMHREKPGYDTDEVKRCIDMIMQFKK